MFNFNDYSLNQLHEKFGCIMCCFYPFDKIENLLSDTGLTEEEYLQSLKDYALSTVHKGIRYYFETPEQLKSFCEMVEA